MFQGSNPFSGLGVLLVIGAAGCLAAVVFSWWVSLWIAVPLTAATVVLPLAFGVFEWFERRRDDRAWAEMEAQWLEKERANYQGGGECSCDRSIGENCPEYYEPNFDKHRQQAGDDSP